MDDTLTLTFFLSEGPTPTEHRSQILPAAILWYKPITQAFDAELEDLGVGDLLNNPRVVGLQASWVDDYDDAHEPVLTASGLILALADDDDQASFTSLEAETLRPNAITVPHFKEGVQLAEWIVNYMLENVYNQDQDEDNNP